MLNRPIRSGTVGLVVAVLMLLPVVAIAILGGVRSFGSALFLAALFIFMSMKVALFWFIRRRASNPAGPALLPVREWQLLSIGYLTSCGSSGFAGA